MRAGAFVDFGARDLAESGDRRIDGETRFLFGDGECRTQVRSRCVELQRDEGIGNGIRPRIAVLGAGGQELLNLRVNLLG